MEKRNDRKSQGDRDRADDCLGGHAREVKERLNHLCEEGLSGPTERQTRQSDAKLRRREIGVEMRDDVAGETGLGFTAFLQRFELAGADFDDGKLRRDIEAIQQDEEKNARKLEQDRAARFPTRGQRALKGEE